jgi:glyoxylase-like metal-dependent hydrolase (beta-lactamase superfamily II)
MLGRSLRRALLILSLAGPCAFGQTVPAFDASGLVKLGDSVRYGSYSIIKLGDGIYQLKDSGDPKARAGGLIGVDMYLIRGTAKALLVDLGNNYIDGYPGDVIPPRKNAAEEFLAVLDGLRGTLPLEVAVTHAHPDHDGMTRAFTGRNTILWMPKGEDLEAPKKQYGNIEPSVYTVFDHATKTFDLGGGRVVQPLLVRGHSNGCTAYLLAKDLMIFTGDSIGIGAGRSLRSAASLKVFAEDTQKLVD